MTDAPTPTDASAADEGAPSPRATRPPRAAGATTAAAPRPRAKRARTAAAPAWTRQPTDKRCPRCDAATLDVATPTDPSAGAPRYACPDAACGFTLPLGARRRRLPCPECGAVVLERRDAPTPAWRCARAPACGYAAPLGE